MSLEKAEKYLEENGILGAGTQVKLTIPELEQVAEANGWVDVCKETEN